LSNPFIYFLHLQKIIKHRIIITIVHITH